MPQSAIKPKLKSVPVSKTVIQDPATARVCTLAGINVAKEKMVTFKKLKDGLDVTLRELDQQARRDQIINRTLLVLKFTKATCDAFIGLAAELTKLVPGGVLENQAKNVKNAYEVTSAGAEYASNAATGGPTDEFKLATTIGKAASEYMPNGVEKHMTKDTAEYLAKSKIIQTELVVGAMNSGADSVKKSAVEYTSELVQFIAKVPEPKWKGLEVAAGIAKEAFKYNDELGKMFDEMIETEYADKDRYQSLKRTLIRTAQQLQQKIDDLEVFIQGCSNEPLQLRLTENRTAGSVARAG